MGGPLTVPSLLEIEGLWGRRGPFTLVLDVNAAVLNVLNIRTHGVGDNQTDEGGVRRAVLDSAETV